jgi:hypothetical protein
LSTGDRADAALAFLPNSFVLVLVLVIVSVIVIGKPSII